MSRICRDSEDRRHEVAFGHDHACGWFVQVWDTESDDYEDDIPILSMDETQLTQGECSPAIIKLVGVKYGISITDEELAALHAATPRHESPFQSILDSVEARISDPVGDG